jgi:uncharacterized protein (DUF1330 family)
MTAYIILEIDVHNAEIYEAYKKLSPPTLNLYGGKYLVRGGDPELVEGDNQPSRIVVLQFEDRQKAKTWLSSPEYAPAWTMRKEAAYTRAYIVDGTD